MDHHGLPRQALTWEPEGFGRRPGRPRQNWKDVAKKDLRKMGISWDEVEEATEGRRSWRNRVAQCVFDAGWTKNHWTRNTKCRLPSGRISNARVLNIRISIQKQTGVAVSCLSVTYFEFQFPLFVCFDTVPDQT